MENYSKAEVQKLGGALVELIHGFGNGLGADDMANAMKALSDGMAASNEIAGDTNAAVFDVVSGMASAQADKMRDDLQPSALP